MTIIWYMIPEIWSPRDRSFCCFRPFFAVLLSWKSEKSKFWKNEKKHLAISFYINVPKIRTICYTVDITHDGYNFYFSFWDICCPFTPLKTQKIKIIKNEKRPGDIIILHMCNKIMVTWYTVLEILWVVKRQTDRKSDISRAGCPT